MRSSRLVRTRPSGCPARLVSFSHTKLGTIPKQRPLQPATGSNKTGVTSDTEFPKPLLLGQSIAMFSAGAVLGPFCDGRHSYHNVLHYADPTVLSVPALHFQLETCWWVPLLFGVAGLILGVSYPLLDQHDPRQLTQGCTTLNFPRSVMSVCVQQTGVSMLRVYLNFLNAVGITSPGWAAVLICIALFVCQYDLSGQLDAPWIGKSGLGGLPAMDELLAGFAIIVWVMFDRTSQGLFMSTLTAVAGPVVEVVIINLWHPYHYEHPSAFGIPSWIPWVYFCGGPAVGLLGRQVWGILSKRVAPERVLQS